MTANYPILVVLNAIAEDCDNVSDLVADYLQNEGKMYNLWDCSSSGNVLS